jgi:hypothetical protein
MEEIPEGLSLEDEHEVVRKLQWREAKDTVIGWLMQLVPEWKVKADLTYAIDNAAPEQVEKRVRWWLRQVAPGCTAICGIEYQQRGSAHAHVIIDQIIDFRKSRELWVDGAGYCWLQAIRNTEKALGYAIKDAVKRGEINIYGPSTTKSFSTENTKHKHKKINPPEMNPNEYEAEAFAELSGRQARKLTQLSMEKIGVGFRD